MKNAVLQCSAQVGQTPCRGVRHWIDPSRVPVCLFSCGLFTRVLLASHTGMCGVSFLLPIQSLAVSIESFFNL